VLLSVDAEDAIEGVLEVLVRLPDTWLVVELESIESAVVVEGIALSVFCKVTCNG